MFDIYCKFAGGSFLRRPILFSRKRKEWGEKSAWGRWVHTAVRFRQEPDLKTLAFAPSHLTCALVRAARWRGNQVCLHCVFEWVRSIETASEISRIVRIRTDQTASPGGSWLREAQTDEGLSALNICFAVSIVLTVPHPALRATCPYPFCPFGTFPPDRGNRPPGEGVFGCKSASFLGRFKGVSQSQICRRASALCRFPSDTTEKLPPFPSGKGGSSRYK